MNKNENTLLKKSYGLALCYLLISAGATLPVHAESGSHPKVGSMHKY